MTASVTYKELSTIVSNKTDNRVNLEFDRISNNTLKVSYQPPMKFLPSVSINIKIEHVSNDNIVLSYNSNGAINLIITGLVNFLENNIPADIIKIDTSIQSISIHLNKIEQLQKPLEMMEILEIYFENDRLTCLLNIKM